MYEGGNLLAGRYRLLEKVGEGGAAEVFRALDTRLDRVVAIKLLRPQFVQDAQSRTRFLNEAKAVAGLYHPNIVDVYDVGEAEDGGMFMAMQFVEGENLKDVLQQRGRLSSAETISIAQQVCYALEAAHSKGLIHRDVKPQNIMLDDKGNIRLTDFGVVKALSAPALTQSGMTFGTAAYLSPEQATGAPVGPASDLYALGCVMYEMLSGTPPFTGDNPAVVAYKQVWEQPRPLHDLVPEVPPSLEGVVMRLLNKDPERRYPSAAVLAAELEKLKAPSVQPTQAVVVDTLAAAAAAPTRRNLPNMTAAERSNAIPMPATSPAFAATQVVPPVRAQVASAGAATAPRAGNAYVPPRPVAQPVQYAAPPPYAPAPAVNVNERRGLNWLPFALVAVLLLGLCGLIGWQGRNLFGGGFLALGGAGTPTTGAVAALSSPTSTEPLGGVVVGSPVAATASPVPPTATQVPPTNTPAPPTGTTVPPTDTPAPPPTDTPVQMPPPPQPAVTDTPAPPVDTPTAVAQAGGAGKVYLDDTAFSGAATRSDGMYHGRTAHWIYGQGTPYHTMTTSFNIDNPPTGEAKLQINGVDSEDSAKTPIRITINNTVIYEGPDPLPDDTTNGPNGPGNWGLYTWRVNPGVFVQGQNTLTIDNLSPSDKVNYPLFFMLDYAVISWGQ